MTKIYNIKEIKKLPDCEIEITVEITMEALESYKEKALKKIKEVAEISGFRKGHVPDNILKEKFGEIGILEDASELAINDCIIEILVDSKINFLGRPDFSISKIALNSPVEFKIKVVTMPEIKLPDYKKIAQKENAIEEKIEEVTEKQIDETIDQIRKMYAGKNHSHTHDEESKPCGENCDHYEEEKLPEITDEFVKNFGDFKDVTDFRVKLKINIAKEKEIHNKNKKQIILLEKIAKETEVEMPKIVIESELEKMEEQFKNDIARVGLQTNEYLKHMKKTWEDLRKEWTPNAEKRAKTQLILQKISLEEKIEPVKEELEKEVENLKEQYKNIDPERIRAYVEMIFVNEAVIKFLENQK